MADESDDDEIKNELARIPQNSVGEGQRQVARAPVNVPGTPVNVPGSPVNVHGTPVNVPGTVIPSLANPGASATGNVPASVTPRSSNYTKTNNSAFSSFKKKSGGSRRQRKSKKSRKFRKIKKSRKYKSRRR